MRMRACFLVLLLLHRLRRHLSRPPTSHSHDSSLSHRSHLSPSHSSHLTLTLTTLTLITLTRSSSSYRIRLTLTPLTLKLITLTLLLALLVALVVPVVARRRVCARVWVRGRAANPWPPPFAICIPESLAKGVCAVVRWGAARFLGVLPQWSGGGCARRGRLGPWAPSYSDLHSQRGARARWRWRCARSGWRCNCDSQDFTGNMWIVHEMVQRLRFAVRTRCIMSRHVISRHVMLR